MCTPKYPKLTLSCILLSLFIGCQNQNRKSGNDEDDEYNKEIQHLDMHYFNFDKVSDLTIFFDSINSKHEIPDIDIDRDSAMAKSLHKCIAGIEAYRRKKQKYYPDSLVKICIRWLGHDAAVIDNHNPGEIDLTYPEWFLMCAAYYSPDITYLVHMQTPDHHAGILNFGQSYNDNPWWAYVFLKREKGFEVQAMGDGTKIRSIFQLEDDNHRKYYLCSNNLTSYEFLQRLYWVKDVDNIVPVAECRVPPTANGLNFNTYYFNKNKLTWQCCTTNRNTDKLTPVKGTAVMTLKLDGENSCFTITDEE